MNSMMLFGIILILLGVVIAAVSQIFLRLWISKFNREWMEGFDRNEMS